MPGVVGVFTAADLGLEPAPSPFNPTVARTILASDRVRYVGEPIVAVVAETREQATDAAEAVIVDYDVLEAVVDLESAVESSTILYDAAGSNVVFDSTALGAPDVTGDEYFADCEVTVSGRFVNQRVAPVPAWRSAARRRRGSTAASTSGRPPSTPRASRACTSPTTSSSRTRCGSARPTSAAASAPRSAPTRRRSSSGRSARRSVGRCAGPRPAASRWSASATAGPRSRTITIGGSRDGKVTHYRLQVLQDSGAFADMGTILAPFMTRPMSSGVYAIPNIECRTTSVVTNTTPTVAYRGAGRPEATAAIERAMDMFAAEIGMDPAEVRRVNLIAPFTEPHTTVDRPDLRRRRLRRLARPGARGRRLRPAARRAEGAARVRRHRCSSASACRSTSRSPAASATARTPRSRSTTTARPPSTPARRRTARATTPRGR